jgi:hypothetical protein
MMTRYNHFDWDDTGYLLFDHKGRRMTSYKDITGAPVQIDFILGSNSGEIFQTVVVDTGEYYSDIDSAADDAWQQAFYWLDEYFNPDEAGGKADQWWADRETSVYTKVWYLVAPTEVEKEMLKDILGAATDVHVMPDKWRGYLRWLDDCPYEGIYKEMCDDLREYGRIIEERSLHTRYVDSELNEEWASLHDQAVEHLDGIYTKLVTYLASIETVPSDTNVYYVQLDIHVMHSQVKESYQQVLRVTAPSHRLALWTALRETVRTYEISVNEGFDEDGDWFVYADADHIVKSYDVIDVPLVAQGFMDKLFKHVEYDHKKYLSWQEQQNKGA